MVITKEDTLPSDQLPEKPFEAERIEPCQANSLSLFRFDRNDYSVPTAYAHHPVVAMEGGPLSQSQNPGGFPVRGSAFFGLGLATVGLSCDNRWPRLSSQEVRHGNRERVG